MQPHETLSPSMSLTFKDFLFSDKKNRKILFIALGIIIIQFSVFKYFYPFASYIHGDSFSYLEAAAKNLDISTYPIGYSRFLRLFSVFSNSDTVLVAFQYLSIQVSILFLLFTIFYFYTPGKVIQYVLLSFMLLNPLFWHLANLISSDCLFASFSITWFTLLLWIILRPSNKIIAWHALLLFLAFTFRYNALIYPFIAIVAFGISSLPLRKKMMGAGAGILLCLVFIGYTGNKYKLLSGHWQFSPFSGWLMANNAMYAYRYVDSADRKPVPQKFQKLDYMIREYFDSTRRNINFFPQEKDMASTVYMWSPGLSLMKYRDGLFTKGKDTAATELKKWSKMGPFYREYGLFIIKQYPWHFVKYFVWPNTQKYYASPVEFLDRYNSGITQVTPETKIWFRYKSTTVKTRIGYGKIWALSFYPTLSGVINVLMLFGLLYFVLLKGWKYNQLFNKILFMAGTVWLLNAVFTIGASSAALRFQSFPVLLSIIFSLLLIDWMVQLMKSMKLSAGDMAKDEQRMGKELERAVSLK